MRQVNRRQQCQAWFEVIEVHCQECGLHMTQTHALYESGPGGRPIAICCDEHCGIDAEAVVHIALTGWLERKWDIPF